MPTYLDNPWIDRGEESRAWSAGVATPVRNNMDPAFAYTNGVVGAATQVMGSYGIVLYAGDTISRLVFRSGAVGANTPTNWWFALYDPALNLLQQTADQLTTAWALNTTKDLALAAPVVVPTTAVYYAAVMVKATTVPNWLGSATSNTGATGGYVAGERARAQTSGSALTTTAPASIAAPTVIIGVPLVKAY